MTDIADHRIAGARLSSVEGIIDRLDRFAEDDTPEIGEMLKAFGGSSIAAALVIPAILVVSPLSGVPGLSAAFGLVIAAVASQLLIGRDHLWLPEFLTRRRLDAGRTEAALQKVRPVARWIDRRTSTPRLKALVTPPVGIVPRFLCLTAGLAMPFFEIVPFSSSILALSVVLLATGILTLDGLVALAGACVQIAFFATALFVAASIF